MAIVTYRYPSSRQLFYVAVVQAFLCHSAATANTIVAVKRGNDFVIVAADSRAIAPNGEHRADQCKIHLLDHQTFFVATGVSSNTASADGETSFNANGEAAKQYKPALPLKNTAEGWANAMKANYYAQSSGWRERIFATLSRLGDRQGTMIMGVFGSESTAGSISVNYEQTTSSVRFFSGEFTDIAPKETSVTLLGTDTGKTLVASLYRVDNPIAERFKKSVGEEQARYGNKIDAYALEMQRALEVAIATKQDPTIGGDVAVAILERGHAMRWFAQTPACAGQKQP